MRHFADPSRCPSCSGPLLAGSSTCPGCHLDLGGPLGHELFATLSHADSLLAQLRQRSWTTAAPLPDPVAASSAPAAGPVPAAGAIPPAGSAPPVGSVPAAGPAYPRRDRGVSVPQILLGLGAVCLLVAALVFLAVTWSVLGVGGRTATLVGFTLTTGVLTAWAGRRGLRGATEALGVVTLGLSVLDLYGAHDAGWLGDLTDPGMTTLVGAVLVAAGLVAVHALGRTDARGFTGGELAATLGALLVSAGLALQDWGTVAARLLLALCLVLALAAGTWALVRAGTNRYRAAAWLLAPLALLDWLALVVAGLDDLGAEPTMLSAWGRLESWPLVAAAVVAVLVALPRRLPTALRVASAAVAVVPLGLALLAPAGDESTTVAILALVALSAVLVALMRLAPAPWGASALAAGALCVLGFTVEALALLGAAVEQYAEAASMGWSGSTGGRLPGAGLVDGEAPWLLPLCVVALIALLGSALRLLGDAPALPRRSVGGPTGVAVAASLVCTLLLYPVPVWTVLLALVAGSLVLAWRALVRDSVSTAATCAAALSVAVVLSWYDERLSAATVAVALVVSAVMHLRTRHELVAAPAAAAVAALLAGLVWTVGAVADAAAAWTALVGLLLLSALVLARPWLPVGLRTPGGDAVLDLAALCAAIVLATTALEATATSARSGWLALYLTVAGAAATAQAITRQDRRRVAWLGGLLLAAATWVRLSDLGVDQPEPYTLPTALALLVVGLLRLRRDRSASTHEALGAGLLLALVPSMLWVVQSPGGARSVLLGLACLGLVVGGAQLRWVAPLVYGAVVGLVVVLVEAGPHVGEAVPRWAIIGGAGALLIALGITWEQRLRDARLVSTYLRALR